MMSNSGTAREFPAALERLISGEDLNRQETASLMDAMMSGAASPVEVSAVLVALRMKGETAEEIAGLVSSMRAHATPVELARPVVDTCGTGGDKAGTFNVSTVAAIVAAAAGATVAKHGNRAASGKCGSADLLEGWGVAIDLPADAVARCVDELRIGFCFAPRFHPAMRHVVPVRRGLGIRTAFNFLGPLTNPAGAQHQTIGVSDPAVAPKMAAVLAALDTTHALVFTGHDGLDELTTTGPSRVWEVRNGTVEFFDFDPLQYGVRRSTVADLQGGELAENMAIADAILAGEQGPRRDIVVLGAGAALRAADLESSWEEALSRAEAAIDDGTAGALKDRWVRFSRELAEVHRAV